MIRLAAASILVILAAWLAGAAVVLPAEVDAGARAKPAVMSCGVESHVVETP